MRTIYFISLILFTSKSFSQTYCSPAVLTLEEQERRDSDSSWLAYHPGQIAYYVALQKNIIPKYWSLRDEVLKHLEGADVSKLQFLHRAYVGQVESYLDEMRSSNRRVIKNLRPSGEITNVIMFETFRVFPDTWALLVNPTVINRNVNHVDVVVMDELYKKYSSRLQPLGDCIRNFAADRKASMVENKTGLSLQGLEKDPVVASKCDLIDILLWATL